jgi:hypothetical protein
MSRGGVDSLGSQSFCNVAGPLRRRNATRKYRRAEFGYYGASRLLAALWPAKL